MNCITENIRRITTPYKDIYTTICLITTEEGHMLFDTGSYDEDIPAYIVPFLEECGVTQESLKYVFISHAHADHAGGLRALHALYPNACILSRSGRLREEYAGEKFISPEDGDEFLGVLKVVTIPGHTSDAAAIYDLRSRTLVTGDCLQLYGIYGSGKWGANITFVAEHLAAIEKLRSMDIMKILTAHDYHPYGHIFEDATIPKALDACVAPLSDIAALIEKYPESSDEDICAKYNESGELPVVGTHVVTALRPLYKKLI